jgi:hypothetical protein
MWRAPLILSFTALITSCASDVANRYYAAQHYPPKDPRQVEILYSAPSRPYEVIAEFQARGETPQGMRKRAAEIGADGVIVTPLGGYFPLNATWAGDPRESNTYSRLVGNAIKYK